MEIYLYKKEGTIKRYNDGDFIGYEIYQYTDRTRRIHTDFVEWLEDMKLDSLPNDVSFDIAEMDKDDYEHTLFANSNVSADDFWDDDDQNRKILVIILPWNWQQPK